LRGYQGDDTYIFNRGDGQDTIYDYGRYQNNYSYYNAGNDTLKFGDGITHDDVIFYMDGNNLVIEYGDTDIVTVNSQANDNNAIEKIELNDGSYLTNIDIQRVTTELLIYADENNIDISNPDNIKNNSEIMSIFTSSWKDAGTDGEYTAPLVLDLNHNDTTSVSLENSNAYFDYDFDGDREHTAWAEVDDAILAMDLNNDGTITNGGELFGDFTKLADGSLSSDGYAALAQYDSNGDNVIDKNDDKFSDLLLWRDTNGDGKSTKNELLNISLSTVTAIHLSREDGITFEEFSENGNIITNETVFDTSASTTGIVRDVWFKYDSNDSVSGNDDIYRFNLGDGNYLIDDNNLNGISTDKLILGNGIVSEQVLMKWDRGTDDLIIGVREHSEDDTPLNTLTDQIRIKDWFKDSGLVESVELADGTTFDRDAIYDKLVSARENSELTLRVLDEDGELTGADYNDVLYGSTGDELLSGKNGDDYLKGLEGDDLLNGGKGDDTINGGTGDDTLIGESGDDFYIYKKGDGRDTIIDSAGNDTIIFGSEISRKDVLFKVNGDDMILSFEYDSDLADEQRDSITIKNYNQSGFEIENLEFSNGESYSIPELIEKNTNHAPTTMFEESSYTLTDVSSQTGIILASDIDGDSLKYTISTSPEHGEIVINDFGIWTYTSNDKYRGEDSAVVTVDDGNGLSTTKTLNFEMIITNIDPIVIEAESNVILQDIREQSGEVGASDEDGDTLSYTVSTQAEHGTLSVDENGIWTYNVDGTYIGTDLAVITVDDGNGGVVTKTLNFDAKVSNPTIDTVSYDLQEDNISTNNLNVINPVGGALTYEIITPSSNGEFSVDENGAYTYNPNQDYNGSDEVVIKVTNEYGLSTTGTLAFDIEAVNDVPTVVSIETTTLKEDDSIISGQIDASDVDEGAVLSYSAATVAGFILNDDGSYSFDASDDAYQHLENGVTQIVTIPVTVSDEHNASVTTDIVFEITGTNDKPIIEDITEVTINEDDSIVTGSITSIDVDDNSTATYTYTIEQAVAGFTLNEDGTYSFNPADDAYQSLAKGEVQEIIIPVTVTDDKGATDTKNLIVSVIGTNDTPTVQIDNESFLLQNIRSIEGKVVADDIDGDTLSYSVLTQAANGIVSVDENGNWSYKADGSFNGNDSAIILVDDGNGGTVTSTLNFTVDGYIYEGEDLIIDEASGNDTLSMDNINKDELIFKRDMDDLQISVADGGVITLKNYFIDVNAGVETLHTAQGDINLSRDVINDVTGRWWCSSFIVSDEQDNLVSGSSTNDYIKGNEGNDIIFGNDRSDFIQGRDGDDLLVGGTNSDYIYGDNGNDNLYGDSGYDYLSGGSGNDSLSGGEGRDTLAGGSESDWLSGGTENDTLYGGSGDDTYHFNIGDANDTIYDADESSFFWWNEKDGGNDTISFGNGINKDDLKLTREHEDLIIKYSDNDSIKVESWFDGDNHKIEGIEFADSSTLSLEEMKDMITLDGTNGRDRLVGLDSLDDKIYAFAGNDTLYGNDGDDFLSGGEGNDKLYGGIGSDTYSFNKGDGSDTISDYSKRGSDDTDTIVFGKDVSKDDISFIMDRGDLLIQYGENDFIKVNDQDRSYKQIEQIELSDGNYMSNDDIELVIQQINAYGDENGMHNIDNQDIRKNTELMQIVNGAWNV
uniref:Ig-like domain-containing protein n=1 Tax=Sulfurimonas sp. TaxID=2022749 RepID=UPI00356278CF